MAYEFFVVMMKRCDGQVFADLHKTNERMYLSEEEANAALNAMGDLARYFHKVKMVGVLADEWYNSEVLTDKPCPDSYEFFVVMMKRCDGKVFADLHKTNEHMYLSEEEADAALNAMDDDLARYFHKVKMVGVLADEWYNSKVLAVCPCPV